MSKDEEINIAYLLKDMSKKQEEHIKASNTFREDMKTSLATMTTHSEYLKTACDENTVDIKMLKDARSQQKGAVWVFGLIGLGGFVELIRKWAE